VTDVIFVTGSCTFLHFFLNSGYNVVIGCNFSNCFPKSGCIFLQLDVLFLCFLHSEIVKGLRCIFSTTLDETDASECNFCHFSTSKLSNGSRCQTLVCFVIPTSVYGCIFYVFSTYVCNFYIRTIPQTVVFENIIFAAVDFFLVRMNCKG
jgi:hypothetical protein